MLDILNMILYNEHYPKLSKHIMGRAYESPSATTAPAPSWEGTNKTDADLYISYNSSCSTHSIKFIATWHSNDLESNFNFSSRGPEPTISNSVFPLCELSIER